MSVDTSYSLLGEYVNHERILGTIYKCDPGNLNHILSQFVHSKMYSRVLLSIAVLCAYHDRSSHAFTVGRPDTYADEPAYRVDSFEWPILAAKIADYLIRLELKYNGHKLQLINITSVRADADNRYDISAKMRLSDDSERDCNLRLLEEYTIPYGELNIDCEGNVHYNVAKRHRLYEGFNEYNPTQLNDFVPTIIDALRQLNNEHDEFDYRLIRIKFVQVQGDGLMNDANGEQKAVIYAELATDDDDQPNELCIFNVTEDRSSTQRHVELNCGNGLAFETIQKFNYLVTA